MLNTISQILQKETLTRTDFITLLSVRSAEATQLVLDKAYQVKTETVGRKVYLRGLIELTNICAKNCFYCGIRAANIKVERYSLSVEEVLQAADFAWKNGFGSLVIQTGEQQSRAFADMIEDLLIMIHDTTNHELSVTLSCGEQELSVYERWRKAGAGRFLLRIETSNRDLYHKIHPNDNFHSFESRIKALNDLRIAGFQVGTGVMIGLPEQSIGDLADDLIFFKTMDIDMIGMGPFIEHADTPLYAKNHMLWPAHERFRMSLLMLALARITMPDINIASSTALETLDPLGRQKGLLAGANVVMPNLTPVSSRKKYQLYNNKPHLDKDAALSAASLQKIIHDIGEVIGFNEAGSSLHFKNRVGSV
ncbi:MAG: [FeFe] hydrogenase H-cluster radical SAM maturase HydE [Bacteroidales bacterium]|nr:[FeFe] hydrogenase H-cluster radical SAM maturase HydE [Bacteroidales bacterium]